MSVSILYVEEHISLEKRHLLFEINTNAFPRHDGGRHSLSLPSLHVAVSRYPWLPPHSSRLDLRHFEEVLGERSLVLPRPLLLRDLLLLGGAVLFWKLNTHLHEQLRGARGLIQEKHGKEIWEGGLAIYRLA